MTHPLIDQLRFARSEFLRGIEGISEEDAQRRFLPMNCISWNVGHLAWQEQRYFLTMAQNLTLFPDIAEQFAYGAPASQPELIHMLQAWHAITSMADRWLDQINIDLLQANVVINGKAINRRWGDLLNRTIYHYWYHLGENMAIRQNLGHVDLPQFVGNIDAQAPYRPEQ
jgi:hypothetical protein